MTPQSVSAWARQGMPALPVEPAAVEAWRAERQGPGRSSATLDEYRAVQIQLKELELAERRGDLIPRADVEEMLGRRAAAFRKALRSLGRKLARKLVNRPDPVDVQAVLEEEFDAALRHWSSGKWRL